MTFPPPTLLNPRVIFTQATEPNDKEEGKLWYDTTTKTLYVSDGTEYIPLESDFVKLGEIINTATTTETAGIDLTGLDIDFSIFKKIIVDFDCLGKANGSTGSNSYFIQLNNDAGATYNLSYVNVTSTSAKTLNSQTKFTLDAFDFCNSTTELKNWFGSWELRNFEGISVTGNSNVLSSNTRNVYARNSAINTITSIKLTSTRVDFLAGSRISVYGYK